MATRFDSTRGAKKPSFATRIRKRIRLLRRKAIFAVFHTKAQPNNPPIVKFQTRARQQRKPSYQLKKWLRNGFRVFHFVQPAPPAQGNTGGFLRKFISFQERLSVRAGVVRAEIKRRKSWAIRKQAKFAQWHTGSITAASGALIPKLQTRFRRIRKLASFAIRKLATFPISNAGTGASPKFQPFRTHKRSVRKASFQLKKWAHYALFKLGVGGPTGQQAIPFAVPNLKLKTRAQRRFFRRPQAKKAARFNKVFNTGTNFTAQPYSFRNKNRPRRASKTKSYSLRKKTGFYVWHTGLTAPASRQIARLYTRKRVMLRVKRNRATGYMFAITHAIPPPFIPATGRAARLGLAFPAFR